MKSIRIWAKAKVFIGLVCYGRYAKNIGYEALFEIRKSG